MTDRDNDRRSTPAPFDTLRTAPTDADVRAALADNDHAAWARLVTALSPRIAGHVHQNAPDITPDDLAEVVQATWVKAWTRRCLFARDDVYTVQSLVRWCSAIGFNTYLDTVRRRRHAAYGWVASGLRADHLLAYQETPDPEPWPETAALHAEATAARVRLLAAGRAAIGGPMAETLPYLAGCRLRTVASKSDVQRAASALGITCSAAKSRMSRLRQVMRGAITRHVGLPPTATLAEVLAAERQEASA